MCCQHELDITHITYLNPAGTSKSRNTTTQPFITARIYISSNRWFLLNKASVVILVASIKGIACDLSVVLFMMAFPYTYTRKPCPLSSLDKLYKSFPNTLPPTLIISNQRLCESKYTENTESLEAFKRENASIDYSPDVTQNPDMTQNHQGGLCTSCC